MSINLPIGSIFYLGSKKVKCCVVPDNNTDCEKLQCVFYSDYLKGCMTREINCFRSFRNDKESVYFKEVKDE